jgi:GDSL-like Lipase/Acylhydrolase
MFRFAATSSPRLGLRDLSRLALACSATLLLSACGGGDRAAEYKPDEVVVFGDESGAFASFTSVVGTPVNQAMLKADGSTFATLKGLTYSVNPLSTFGPYYRAVSTPDCAYSVDDIKKSTVTIDSSFVASCQRLYQFADDGILATTLVKVEDGAGNVSATAERKTTGLVYDCSGPSIWSQVVAHAFNKGYGDDCPLDGDGAYSFAAAGAKVADVATQITSAQNASRGLGKGTMVIVMTGQNDAIEIYNNAALATQEAKVAEARARAMTLSQSIVGLLRRGAKVLVVNVPALGFAPAYSGTTLGTCSVYGETKRTDNAVLPHNCVMDAIVREFNTVFLEDGMRAYALSRGDVFAHVDAEALTLSYLRNTSYVNAKVCDSTKYTYPDGTTGAAAEAGNLRFCTSNTLVTDGSTSTYLWADDTHIGPVLQLAIGSLAATRAATNF